MTKLNNERAKRLRRQYKKSSQSLIFYQALYENGLMKIKDNLYSRSFSLGEYNYVSCAPEQKLSVIEIYEKILNSLYSDNHFQLLLTATPVEEERMGMLMFKDDDDPFNTYRREYNQMIMEKYYGTTAMTSINRIITITSNKTDKEHALNHLIDIEAAMSRQFQTLGVSVNPMTAIDRLTQFSKILQDNPYFHMSYEDLKISNLTTKSFIAPNRIKLYENKLLLNNTFSKVLYIRHYPNFLVEGLITELLYSGTPLVISILAKPYSVMEAMKKIKNEKVTADIDMIKSIRRGREEGLPTELSVGGVARETSESADKWRYEIQENDQNLFSGIFCVMIKAKSNEELDKNTDLIKTIGRKYLVEFDETFYAQEEALNSMLPIGYPFLNVKRRFGRDLTTNNLANHVPFTHYEIISKSPKAICYGQNQISKSFITLDRKKDLNTGSGLILGIPGSGKSVMAKAGEIIPTLLRFSDDRVIIVDPEDEYSDIGRAFNAQIIDIHSGSNSHLNLMDLPKRKLIDNVEYDEIGQKSNLLMGLFESILSSLSDEEISIIDRVTRKVYDEKEKPNLKDWYETLIKQPEEGAKKLALKSESYTIGSQNIFSHHTNIDIENRFVIFNLKKLTGKLKPFALMVIQDYIWNQVVNNQGKTTTWIYFDELQLYFKYQNQAQFFTELYSRIRKYGAICTGITQNPETLTNSVEGRKLMSNCEFFVLLKLRENDISALDSIIQLTSSQKQYVLRPQSKGTGLIVAGSAIVPFENEISKNTKLYQLVATDA